jgi:PilZ domain-containing protein
MKTPFSSLERRSNPRHFLRVPIRIHLWKSQIPEQESVSQNLSLGGALFPAELAVQIGTVLELRLEMPEEISGENAAEWHCSGHVVRIDKPDSSRGRKGIAVQFDCYEVERPLPFPLNG